jgi:hypothetical protein
MISFHSGGSAFDVQVGGLLPVTSGTTASASLAFTETVVNASPIPEPGLHPPDATAMDPMLADRRRGPVRLLRRAYPHLVQRAAARSLPLVLDSYPATFQIEDLAAEAGVTPDDMRDYLRREIERRQLQERDEQPALVPERAEA